MNLAQHRAVQWLHLYGRRYPSAWQDYARLLADPPEPWPSWCYCPLAGSYAVLSQGGECTAEQAADVGPLGALAAWRPTQGIYRFHPALLDELIATTVSGELPAEVLKRLPAWCVYVETPQRTLWGLPLHGFFAFLEYDVNEHREELRLGFDIGSELEAGTPLAQCVVHLGGTLEEGIRAAVRTARVQALRGGLADRAPSLVGIDGFDEIGGLVSLVLYLCAEDAEIEERRPLPAPVVHGKKRAICPAAKAPLVHPCGYRVGSALELGRAKLRHAGGTGDGSSITPHVRRAHWHRYWTGPRDGERRIALRWLSPILVALKDVPTEATVIPVRDD